MYQYTDLVYFTTRVPDTSDASATRVKQARHEWHEYNTSETRMRRVRHEWNTIAIQTTRVRQECYTDNKSTTRVENFDFNNDTSENICSHSYVSYIANRRLQGEEQFHSKNYLSEMPRSHAKIRLKSAPQKLNFVMTKAISKSYTLDCSCKCPSTFPHSYA